MFYKPDSSSMLQIPDLTFRNIKYPAYFLQCQPVSISLIPHLFIKGMDCIVKICHSFKHCFKQLLFNLYNFQYCAVFQSA